MSILFLVYFLYSMGLAQGWDVVLLDGVHGLHWVTENIH